VILETDPVARFLDGCHGAGIRDPVAFIASKMPVVFNYLNDCLPRGILPTDVDGEVEINGKWLRFEYKHESVFDRGAHPKGQLLSFIRLTKSCPFTIFYVGVDRAGEIKRLWTYRDGKLTQKYEPCSLAQFKGLVKSWAEWADRTCP